MRVEDAFTEGEPISLLLPEKYLVNDGAGNDGGSISELHIGMRVHRQVVGDLLGSDAKLKCRSH